MTREHDGWERAYRASDERDADFQTLSGEPLQPLFTEVDLSGFDPERDLGDPGQYPFVRGVYPTMYRGRLWTMRQFAGYGTPAETNARYKFLLAQGQGGLSVAFDMPTLMGRDSDDQLSEGEVGRCGVATDSLADVEQLFDGIPLGDITTSMTISGPAVVIFAFFLAAAEKQGLPWDRLDGTLQTDILKEYIAQKEWIFPPRPHLRLIGAFPSGTPSASPATTSARRGRTPGRSSPTRWPTGSPTSSSARPADWTWTDSRRDCRSSSTRTSTSSRRSRSTGRPGGSGPGG
jgi:methylmalonyl-CoA mutase N-terminal domain/subunit